MTGLDMVTGVCPNCGHQIDLALSTPDDGREVTVTCPGCEMPLRGRRTYPRPPISPPDWIEQQLPLDGAK